MQLGPFLLPKQPNSSQIAAATVTDFSEKPKAEVWHFLPELSPSLRQETAFSVTQVASFLPNNGVPYDKCLNNTPMPLTSEISGDKSHLVAMPCWSKLLWYRLSHCIQASGKHSHTQTLPPNGPTQGSSSSPLKAHGRQSLSLHTALRFSSLHSSCSLRQHSDKYLRRNKAILDLFPHSCPGCTAISCKPTPGPTCAQKRKAPCLAASQLSKCRTRIRKAHSHPQFSISKNMSKGKCFVCASDK